jgi:hypothetical protein
VNPGEAFDVRPLEGVQGGAAGLARRETIEVRGTIDGPAGADCRPVALRSGPARVEPPFAWPPLAGPMARLGDAPLAPSSFASVACGVRRHGPAPPPWRFSPSTVREVRRQGRADGAGDAGSKGGKTLEIAIPATTDIPAVTAITATTAMTAITCRALVLAEGLRGSPGLLRAGRKSPWSRREADSCARLRPRRGADDCRWRRPRLLERMPRF